MNKKRMLAIFNRFMNPINESTSIVGDISDVRMFREDWEEFRDYLNSQQSEMEKKK